MERPAGYTTASACTRRCRLRSSPSSTSCTRGSDRERFFAPFSSVPNEGESMLRPDRPVAIIGAGIAGLTAAEFLRRRGIPHVLFEGGPKVAGLAESYHDPGGFSYDFGAHFITNRLAAAVGVGAQCR